MKKATFILVVMVFVSLMAGGLWAQEIKFPTVSQKASVTQVVGLTDITVNYFRPGVKGRVIWGGLVPYDKTWRTGANNATTIEFSNDVMIEGNKLAAGKYGLFTIPGVEEWVVIFSKQGDIWGDYEYKESEDVLRIKVKPMPAPFCEWMMFAFTDLAEDSAKVVLHWEKLMIGFTVKVDTKGMIFANIEKTMGRYWVPPYQSARFAFENGMVDKAKELIDLSVNLKAGYGNMLLKAKIYQKLAKNKKDEAEVVKMLEKAAQFGKALPQEQQEYAKEAQKLLDELKTKKK
ncbi:MAG: DUF2911 domain-containing protein [Candidatus Aminicenantes bacterium]|nr:DUF2911 domain-containing protein [Candidatus Aminicenantes bacterium]